MRHHEAMNFILEKLRKELPDTLRYHSTDHTLDVIESVKRIAKTEAVSPEEEKLLLTAAAYHDSGFIYTYKDHEEAGCDIAARYLPGFEFSDQGIKAIQKMIMATKIPQTPQTLPDKILCDADLDYLGRGMRTYYDISQGLYEEMKLNGIDIEEEQWLNIQIGFLENHNYWTSFAGKHRKPGKEKVLEDLKGQKAPG